MAESKIAPKSVTAKDNITSVPSCSLKELLEESPLHSQRKIPDYFSQPEFGNVAFPDDIWVHCEQKKCEGVRRHFKHESSKFAPVDDVYYHSITYCCSNCKASIKVFTIKSEPDGKNKYSAVCAKIYQEPPFGQPIPNRLFHIIGESNRELFLQARRAIARGLGIGAYAYYRSGNNLVRNRRPNVGRDD